MTVKPINNMQVFGADCSN